MNLPPEFLNMNISQNTIELLASSQAKEILRRHVEFARSAFLEPGLHDRLHQEQISSLQGGTKVFRIGNSLRGLSHHLAMLAFGNSLGVSIPGDVQ